ncbi:hypothetical protein F5Y18DRAFT_397139 [Xylariaceae sp. FL1019]|nr:hypothetical protein F5Y18DRAFT_397139 [Xylariaceae sp. FL1019]
MERSIKAEPGLLRDRLHDHHPQIIDARPSYKSWKKKYRKMRITFDNRMRESEELHSIEQRAIRTAKRIAIENDRLLDLLLDINDSPQIPFERRIDLTVDDEEDEDATDNEDSENAQKPTKSLKKLVQQVPHMSYSAYISKFPEVADDIDPKNPDTHPIAFLSADDVDEYLWHVDASLGLEPKPSRAPCAVDPAPTNPQANFALKNPTSVYNWLRRNAPKTFLQDLEKEKDKDKDDRDKDDGRKRKGTGTRGGRKSTGGRKDKEREKQRDKGDGMDWEEELAYDAPKGKRKRDDDGGYRPKGGSSRPAKKRKSKDLVASSAKAPKSRKSMA